MTATNPGDESAQSWEDDRRGAVFGDDRISGEERKYRYQLWRRWHDTKPTVAFIMLNPSTADETDDDPTIRRCIGYARKWGFGKLVVGNLFAVRTPDPENLGDFFDPYGPQNDEFLRAISDEAEKVIAAWGRHGTLFDRAQEVVEMLDVDIFALDTTKNGQPIHPLYQPADIDLEPFDWPPGGGE